MIIYNIFNYFSYEIKYSPTKYIETTERGLVVISVNEADSGRYDCHLGGSLLCSYNITVDAHRYLKNICFLLFSILFGSY